MEILLRRMGMPDKGDYVLATKFNDGDPGDNWAVGFYDREENGRHFVVDSTGSQLRHSGFRRAGRITTEYGNWLLGVAAKILEQSPPGTVNLWTMATDRARGVDPHAETSEPDSQSPQPLDGTAKLT
jgi:hypothetical protein